jgi:hypothetical protein
LPDRFAEKVDVGEVVKQAFVDEALRFLVTPVKDRLDDGEYGRKLFGVVAAQEVDEVAHQVLDAQILAVFFVDPDGVDRILEARTRRHQPWEDFEVADHWRPVSSSDDDPETFNPTILSSYLWTSDGIVLTDANDPSRDATP